MSAQPPRFRPGDLIADHYEIQGFVAHGSVSEVYRVLPKGGGQDFALKIVNENEETGADSGSADRRVAFFLREAAVTAQLEHPNVVRLHEVGYDPNAGHFLAMEFLQGRPLDQLVAEEGVFTEDRARGVVSQVLSALSAAHRQNILHRDLKPGNIHVIPDEDGDDHVKLFDFGVAKLWNKVQGAREPTRTGTIVGTPMWMSPEQCRGHDLTVRSDVYSVGAVLYFLLTGQAPFQNSSIFQVLNDVLSTVPPSVNDLRTQAGHPRVSRALDKAVKRALAKGPEQRFVDADHMGSYLDRDAPSTEWPAIPTTMVLRFPRDSFPGLLALQRHFREPQREDLLTLVYECLERLGESNDEGIVCNELSEDAVSILFQAGDTPTMTILEATGLAFRLRTALARVNDGPISALVAAGVPSLGLDTPENDDSGPLFSHMHHYLYAHLEYERESRDMSPTRGRVMATPEWLQPLRTEFNCCRLTADPHGPIHVQGLQEPSDTPEQISAQALVLEALAAQEKGLEPSVLEEVLFMSLEPIQALSAVSDLQSSGLVLQDHRGRISLADRTGPLPRTELGATERRLLFLRFATHLNKLDGGTGSHLLPTAINLENAHPLSAVRLWAQIAETSEPQLATTCLLRALRLAATRQNHELMPRLLRSLSQLAASLEVDVPGIGWAVLHEKAEAKRQATISDGKVPD